MQLEHSPSQIISLELSNHIPKLITKTHPKKSLKRSTKSPYKSDQSNNTSKIKDPIKQLAFQKYLYLYL